MYISIKARGSENERGRATAAAEEAVVQTGLCRHV